MPAFKNIYVIPARDAAVDSVDSMLTLTKIIDNFKFEINKKDLPTNGVDITDQNLLMPYQFIVATAWQVPKSTNNSELNFRIVIQDSKGNRHEGPLQNQGIPADFTRFNITFTLNDLPVNGSGEYTIIAELLSGKDGDVLASGQFPLQVTLTVID